MWSAYERDGFLGWGSLVHTNLVAHDWKRLTEFYVRVFGCIRAPPERHHHGDWLERGIGVRGAEMRGAHLRLPGHGDLGPTLEIFSDDETLPQPRPMPNRAGCECVGETVAREIDGAGTVRFAYVRDPEGNIIELQSRSQSPGVIADQTWARMETRGLSTPKPIGHEPEGCVSWLQFPRHRRRSRCGSGRSDAVP